MVQSSSRSRRRVAAPLIVLVAALAALWLPSPAQAQSRVVAVGDVHGAYDELTGILRAAGVVDEQLAWAGGDTIMVQTGDFLDRGTDVRKVMDLFMRLQSEAESAGGKVIVLNGDHEVMNLVGELRDTTPELLATFAAEDRDKLLGDAVKEHEKVYFDKSAAWRRATRPQREDIKDKWRADQAPGRIEYLRAMGPDGLYGSWLRTLPVMAVVNDVLFMHAGMAPEMAAWTVEAVNERVADEIAYLDAARAHLRRESLLTTFANLSETINAAAMDAGGVDWFEAVAERPNKPPVLPEGEYSRLEKEERTAALLRMNGWFALAPRGPLWYRGLAESPEAALAAQLPGIFSTLGVRAVVAGHTPQVDGIVSRVDGRVYLIDTGMLQSVYKGRPSALVFDGDAVNAVYSDGATVALPPVAQPEPVMQRP